MISRISSSVVFLLVAFVTACTLDQPKAALHISLINHKKALQFTGIDKEAVNELAADSTGRSWQALVPVFKMPADRDLKNYQPTQPGTYKATDSVVVFTPDTPFVKGQTYFVRWYRYDQNKRPTDHLNGRRKIGRQEFTDLIFRQ